MGYPPVIAPSEPLWISFSWWNQPRPRGCHGAEAVISAFPKMSSTTSASSPLPKLPCWPRACLSGGQDVEGLMIFFGGKENMVFKLVLRTRETKKLERCHVNTFVKQVFEQSCAFYQFSPVTVPVHCRQWNVEGVGVPSVESEESGMLSGECSV